ncbi:hypothetical protein L7F22_056260 [Adiantum nelumboides]|nr:hypothetical protein [Adiantum nelumboides]
MQGRDDPPHPVPGDRAEVRPEVLDQAGVAEQQVERQRRLGLQERPPALRRVRQGGAGEHQGHGRGGDLLQAVDVAVERARRDAEPVGHRCDRQPVDADLDGRLDDLLAGQAGLGSRTVARPRTGGRPAGGRTTRSAVRSPGRGVGAVRDAAPGRRPDPGRAGTGCGRRRRGAGPVRRAGRARRRAARARAGGPRGGHRGGVADRRRAGGPRRDHRAGPGDHPLRRRPAAGGAAPPDDRAPGTGAAGLVLRAHLGGGAQGRPGRRARPAPGRRPPSRRVGRGLGAAARRCRLPGLAGLAAGAARAGHGAVLRRGLRLDDAWLRREGRADERRERPDQLRGRRVRVRHRGGQDLRPGAARAPRLRRRRPRLRPLLRRVGRPHAAARGPLHDGDLRTRRAARVVCGGAVVRRRGLGHPGRGDDRDPGLAGRPDDDHRPRLRRRQPAHRRRGRAAHPRPARHPGAAGPRRAARPGRAPRRARRRPVRLPRRPGGPARDRPRRPGGDGDRAGRAVRCGQVHTGHARRPVPRRHRGCGADRRRRRPGDRARGALPPRRLRPAGRAAGARHRRRQRPARQARCDGGRAARRLPGRADPRPGPRAAPRLRLRGRAGRAAVRGRGAAGVHRPRAARRHPGAGARRGDRVRRPRVRGRDPGRAVGAGPRPDGDRRRAPALDGHRRRPDRRGRRRGRVRVGHARRAAGP